MRAHLLWHKRLGHILKKMMDKLVNDVVFWKVEFTDFWICIDCIKEKQVKTNEKGVMQSSRLLKIIQTDVQKIAYAFFFERKIFHHIYK